MTMPHPLSTSIRLQRLHEDAVLPSAEDMRIYAHLPDGKIGVPPGHRKVVSCGFCMELDSGYDAQVQSLWLGPWVEAVEFEPEVRVVLRNTSPETLLLEPQQPLGRLQILPRVRTVLSLETGEES